VADYSVVGSAVRNVIYMFNSEDMCIPDISKKRFMYMVRIDQNGFSKMDSTGES